MKNVIATFFIFFLYCQPSFAKGIKMSNNTTLHVKVNDVNLEIGEDIIIKIQISAFAFGGLEFFKSKDFAYEQVALKDGNTFNISSPLDVFYMYIYYEGGSVPTGLCYEIDNIYLIKAGSELTINLDQHDIVFSGEGAVIPNIQSQIIKHGYKVSTTDLKLLNCNKYLPYFQKLDKSRDSALQIQLRIIENNKIVLGDYYVKVLTANCYGYRYYAQLKGYDSKLKLNDVIFRIFKTYYSQKSNQLFLHRFSGEILNASPIFANYLIEDLIISEKIKNSQYGISLSSANIRNILQKINTNFGGILKDKLLTVFALKTNKNENALPFFDEIFNNVKTKSYNNLLLNKMKVKQNDIAFKDFILEDEKGKRYTLDSFKNKVVVLDFWFTGCENCKTLNEAMKPIVKHFSNNPIIIFVNISIDRNKELWLKSVKMGNYTHHDGINLYTNGEGANHDLIRYYNITGFPTVFVIKNGLMFSSLPPRPSLMIAPGQGFSVNGLRLIELLEKAIKF